MSAIDPASPPEEIVRRQKSPGRGRGVYVVLVVVIGLVLVVVGANAAGLIHLYGGSSTGVCGGNVVLNGAGSTLVAPLMFQWATSYTDSTVNYNSTGSGGGIAQITSKTVDFGASDAPLSSTQRGAIPSPGVVTIPESVGAAVPIYNLPGLNAPLRFNGSALAAIYLGTMTNWNNSELQALNPGVTLPNAAIVPVFRADGSGTTFIWTSYLSSQNTTWRNTLGFSTALVFPAGIGEKGNAGVTQAVKSTVDAIGYVDINYALTDSLSYGAVENPAGHYVLANLSNIASAVQDSNVSFPAATGDWYNVSVLNAKGPQDYPISSFTYLFVYKDLGAAYGSSYGMSKAAALTAFLRYIVSPTGGQSQAAALYYVPLTAQVAANDLTTINSLTFNGGTIPVC